MCKGTVSRMREIYARTVDTFWITLVYLLCSCQIGRWYLPKVIVSTMGHMRAKYKQVVPTLIHIPVSFLKGPINYQLHNSGHFTIRHCKRVNPQTASALGTSKAIKSLGRHSLTAGILSSWSFAKFKWCFLSLTTKFFILLS